MAENKTFTFTHDGKEYKFAESFDKVRTPRFLRANRRRDELDMAFTIIEEVAGDEALEAIDSMNEKEFVDFSKEMLKAMSDGASVGESSGS